MHTSHTASHLIPRVFHFNVSPFKIQSWSWFAASFTKFFSLSLSNINASNKIPLDIRNKDPCNQELHCTSLFWIITRSIDFLTKTYERITIKTSQFSQIFIDEIEIVVSRACHSLSYTRWPDVTTEEGEEEGGRMSRTTHDATVHSGERFGVEEAANCRVIVERHLAHFQLRIHPDLKNIDLDQSLLRNRCFRETETETEGRE